MSAATAQTEYSVPGTFGWATVPCPGCGVPPGPKQPTTVVRGEWVSWHRSCYQTKSDPCRFCSAHHEKPHDGSCLL